MISAVAVGKIEKQSNPVSELAPPPTSYCVLASMLANRRMSYIVRSF